MILQETKCFFRLGVKPIWPLEAHGMSKEQPKVKQMLQGENLLTSPVEVPLSFVRLETCWRRKTLKTKKFLREHHDDGCTRQGHSQDFQEGEFQIGSNENGWSKILTLRTYKALAFTLRKQKTPWLPLSERVYHFLDIYVSVVIDVHQRQPRLSLA